MAKKREKSRATILAQILLENAEIFQFDDETFYSFEKKTLATASRQFERHLTRVCAARLDKAIPNPADIDGVRRYFEALAEDNTRPVYKKCAIENGILYVDLGDGSSAKITESDWSIESPSPVRFYPYANQRPLPKPVHGGDIHDLKRIINYDDERQFALTLLWLLSALQPKAGYPVLLIQGPKGAAKSTAMQFLTRIIDPQIGLNSSVPKNEEDVGIHAKASHVMTIDNISYLNKGLSDVICQIATGGSQKRRVLYTTDREMVMNLRNPLILAGITLEAQSDLADRVIPIHLSIPKERHGDRTMESLFQELHPKLLGCVFTLLTHCLKHRDEKLIDLPRMADIIEWSHGIEPFMGWPAGYIQSAFAEESRAFADDQLQEGILFHPILDMLRDGPIKLPAHKLLAKLKEQNPETEFPKTPRGLGGMLRRDAPDFAKWGIDISFPPKSHGINYVVITATRELPGSTPYESINRLTSAIAEPRKPATSVVENPAEALARYEREYVNGEIQFDPMKGITNGVV